MSDRSIAESVRYLAGTHQKDEVTVIDATVNSVDMASRTCEVTAVSGSAGNIITGVRLMPSVDDGVLIIPTDGSTVTVAFSVFIDPVIIGYSGFDNMALNGGEFGGLAKVVILTQKLNNLEKLLNDLIVKYNAHVHPVVSVGSPTGPVSVLETGTLTPTEQAEIENTTITHG
jgi:hypothetical protein